jgi:hypothetical protein
MGVDHVGGLLVVDIVQRVSGIPQNYQTRLYPTIFQKEINDEKPPAKRHSTTRGTRDPAVIGLGPFQYSRSLGLTSLAVEAGAASFPDGLMLNGLARENEVRQKLRQSSGRKLIVLTPTLGCCWTVLRDCMMSVSFLRKICIESS